MFMGAYFTIYLNDSWLTILTQNALLVFHTETFNKVYDDILNKSSVLYVSILLIDLRTAKIPW